MPCLCKQSRSRSTGFWRSQLIWICTVCHYVCKINKLDQVTWLAENSKWVWHCNLFSMARVNYSYHFRMSFGLVTGRNNPHRHTSFLQHHSVNRNDYSRHCYLNRQHSLKDNIAILIMDSIKRKLGPVCYMTCILTETICLHGELRKISHILVEKAFIRAQLFEANDIVS